MGCIFPVVFFYGLTCLPFYIEHCSPHQSVAILQVSDDENLRFRNKRSGRRCQDDNFKVNKSVSSWCLKGREQFGSWGIVKKSPLIRGSQRCGATPSFQSAHFRLVLAVYSSWLFVGITKKTRWLNKHVFWNVHPNLWGNDPI